LGRPVRKVAVEKYGAIPNAASDQVPVMQITVKLEDFVKKWNKIRNDNVVTKAPEVIAPEEPPEEASDEETNPLDEGVVV
jgi:Ribonuclease G/E